MATLLPNGRQQFLDANGAPIAGGSVAFYTPNTLTPKDTWQDPGATILNTNPIILDGSGEAVIYGAGSYRQIVKDSLGNQIWDELTADTAVGGLAWGGTSTGTPNAQVIAASSFSQQDGQQVSFIVGTGLTNTGATTVAPGGGAGIPILKNTGDGPVPLDGNELLPGNAVTLIYDAGRGAFLFQDALLAPIGNGDLGSLTYLPIDGTNELLLPQGANDTVVLLTATQTLTHKTLTAPVISGGTLTSVAATGSFNGTGATQGTGDNSTNLATTAFVNNEIAANVYAGGNVNNTVFPIGTPLIIGSSGTRNQIGTVGLDTGDSRAFDFGAGTVISGTWSCKGTVAGGSIVLVQRVG